MQRAQFLMTWTSLTSCSAMTGLVAVVSLTSLSLGFLTSVTGTIELLYKANTRIKGDFIYLHQTLSTKCLVIHMFYK